MVVDSNGVIEYDRFADIASRRIDERLTPSFVGRVSANHLARIAQQVRADAL